MTNLADAAMSVGRGDIPHALLSKISFVAELAWVKWENIAMYVYYFRTSLTSDPLKGLKRPFMRIVPRPPPVWEVKH